MSSIKHLIRHRMPRARVDIVATIGATRLPGARVLMLAAAVLVAACRSGGDDVAPAGPPAAAPPAPPALVALSLDPALKQCVLALAAANGLSQASDFTALTCAGAGDLAGLEAFARLRDIDLRGGSFRSLVPLVGMALLERVDLRGVHGLYCDDIDSLIAARPAATVLAEDICRASVRLGLDLTRDVVLDIARARVYVALPSSREIAVISPAELAVVDRIPLPGIPSMIDLSIDGTRLFVTLGNNSVGVLDLATHNVYTITVAPDSWVAWDVVEVQPDRLFVTTGTYGGSVVDIDTFVAQVRLDQNAAVSIVADGQNLGYVRVGTDGLLVSPARDFVYVADANSVLYKLSLADPDAGIVLERQLGTYDADHVVLNATGTLMTTRAGQVLRTSSFEEHGRFPQSATQNHASAQTSNGFWAPRLTEFAPGFLDRYAGQIDLYSFDTLSRVRTVDTRCTSNLSLPDSIHPFNADQDFVLMLGGSVACIEASISRSTRDPLRLLRFTDLALEGCIRAEAQRRGFTQPEQFVTLDCSDLAEPIHNLEGIERLTNLQHLDISGSALSGRYPEILGFVTQLDALRSFTAVDAGLHDITALSRLSRLTTATLYGNPALRCDRLDELASTGIAVSTDYCTESMQLRLDSYAVDLVLNRDRTRAFVSAGYEILEIDVATLSIVRRFGLPGLSPAGIELSADGDTLFVALGFSLAYLDLASGQLELVDLSSELGGAAYDVIEIAPDRVLVSGAGNPSNGHTLALVRRDLGNTKSTVAGGRGFYGNPRFAAGDDRSSVFMVAGGSTSRIYRLDATQASIPVVAEREGSNFDLRWLSAAPNGSRIYFNGAVIDATTLGTLGGLPGLTVVPSRDGARVYVVDLPAPVGPFDPLLETAGIYDPQTLARTGVRNWGCGMDYPDGIEETPDGLIAFRWQDLCAGRVVPY